MSTVALSGNDTFILNGKKLSDFADGDIFTVTYPNESATVKTGKDGNSIFGLNESGRQADVMLKLIRGSSDDKFLNGLFSQQKANFAGFPLMFGEATKKIGINENGTIISDTQILSGGVFVKPPESKSNVEGDSEQSTSTWHLKFSNAPRVLT